MKTHSIVLLLFSLLLNVPKISFSQDSKERQALEELDKKKGKSQDEVQRELIKHHLKIQKKATRKRIKKSRREAERRKKGRHPDLLWNRWFGRKQQKKRRKRT